MVADSPEDIGVRVPSWDTYVSVAGIEEQNDCCEFMMKGANDRHLIIRRTKL